MTTCICSRSDYPDPEGEEGCGVEGSGLSSAASRGRSHGYGAIGYQAGGPSASTCCSHSPCPDDIDDESQQLFDDDEDTNRNTSAR